jgi:hypothetical protein
MSIDTDASELSPRRMREQYELLRDFKRRYPESGNGNISGSPKFANFMLSVIAILLAGAIGGQIYFNNQLTEKVANVATTVALIIDCKTKVRCD